MRRFEDMRASATGTASIELIVMTLSVKATVTQSPCSRTPIYSRATSRLRSSKAATSSRKRRRNAPFRSCWRSSGIEVDEIAQWIEAVFLKNCTDRTVTAKLGETLRIGSPQRAVFLPRRISSVAVAIAEDQLFGQ